jgi:hypothetical protein
MSIVRRQPFLRSHSARRDTAPACDTVNPFMIPRARLPTFPSSREILEGKVISDGPIVVKQFFGFYNRAEEIDATVRGWCWCERNFYLIVSRVTMTTL